VADFDGDAVPDLAVTSYEVAGATVYLGRDLEFFSFRNVTADHSITVSFAANTYGITASAGANGSISPSGSVNVAYGDDQSFTITPDMGYMVQDVLVDNVSVGAVTSYTFDDVASAHTIAASFTVITDVATAPPVTRTGLEAPAPNPFNPSTTIRYSLLETGRVRISIFDPRGRLVRSLVDGVQIGPRWHSVVWDGRSESGIASSAGVYFARLDAPGVSATRRLVLVK
jgi:hypothetical protein